MGSVRGITDDYGQLEERYEYDAFGKPYAGDLTQGMNLGYTGKPYDTVTEMYNYGYRDYAPEVARFTTVDPIRDGANWFTYVNNDPVNWVDLWGLIASDVRTALAAADYTTTLGVLVNTSKLASIISSRTDLLDAATANYVKSLTTDQLTSEFNNVTVAMGVDKANVLGMAANHGVSLPNDIDGLTVGNTVFIFNQPPTDSNGRITELDSANLVAHEGAIHGSQYKARGSVEAFLNEYINDPAPYEAKVLERAAYNYGPYNQDAINAGSLNPPLLEWVENQGWFR
jgi:RHS repeat-associated protein